MTEMEKQTTIIGARDCRIYAAEHPVALLVQPMGRHELGTIDSEAEAIAASGVPFVMAAFAIDDWDRELTPWADPAVSTDPEVGNHATDTLLYIENALLPWLRTRFGDNLPCIVGGYSLGGLFALWASSRSESFAGVAAASPSVWIKGWLSYAEHHPTHAANVYMSLGDREEFAPNPSIARVGDCIRVYHEMLLAQLGEAHTAMIWNIGNHFQNTMRRTSSAFVWCLQQL